MMKCPVCNSPVKRERIPNGEVMYCPSCGWGMDRARALREQAESEEPVGHAKPNLVLVMVGLVFAVAFIVGPYVAMMHYLPNVEPWMQLTYWLTMVCYLGIAATTTVHYDDTNLGWGGGLIDNPFSYEDDRNRLAMGVAIALVPGKMIKWSVVGLIRCVRG